MKLSLLAAVLFTVGAAASVQAQEGSADREAQMHFRAGTSYFERGQYEDAAREFRASYELSHRVALLYNVYLANERLGRYAEAADALEAFLDGTEDLPNREALDDRVANLRQRAAEQKAQQEANEQAEEQASEAPAEEPRGEILPLGAWIGFSVAAAGVLTFAIAGGLALAEDHDLTDTCGKSCTDAQVAPLRHRTIAADVGLGLAIAGAATGLVFVLLNRDDGTEQPAAEAAVAPWIGRHGGGATAQVRF